MDVLERLIKAFETQFDSLPEMVVRAPGRVNLIGEHTDYNDGFVLPMAINQAVWIALQPAAGNDVTVHSLAYNETRKFNLQGLTHTDAGWPEYIKGVAAKLREAGHNLRPWRGVIFSDIPIGAGLSSSAALEICSAQAFAAVSDIPWKPKAMALLAQKAENEWVGVNSGNMDQLTSALGKAGHALLIDCRSLEADAVPLPDGIAVVILDTCTRRGLVNSKYNERREQCEQAAAYFGFPALRDISLEYFYTRASGLPELPRKRALHVISENQRTIEAAEAMRVGDVEKLGRLMDASHASLRDNFEVSTDALNTMVECAQTNDRCYGARMTGGGFGGSVIALVRKEAVVQFIEITKHCYEERIGLSPLIYIGEAADGAAIVDIF
jgi:galactokinase